jgi:DNA-binding NtrC family response regulator
MDHDPTSEHCQEPSAKPPELHPGRASEPDLEASTPNNLETPPANGSGHAFGSLDCLTTDNHFRSLEEIETEIIRLAIGHYRGRMSEVARRLGIGRSTLYRKLSQMEMNSKG